MAIGSSPDDLARAARDALGRGDPNGARRIAVALVQRRPDLAEGHFLVGMAEAEMGRITAAIEAVANATRLKADAEYQAQFARLLVTARRDGAARAAADAAVRLGPRDALTHDTIGCVYARLGDHAASVAPFAAAVALAPEDNDFGYNLAAALGFVGRVEEAEAAFEAVLARDAGNGRVHYALSGLRRQSRARNHIARLEAVLADPRIGRDPLRLRYALAKEYEDIGEDRAAFAHLHAANTARRREIGYDFAADTAIFDALERGFADPAFFAGASSVEAAPIFVVGMPRTGTTLVDRILSSHPHVHSVGELQAMPLAVKQASGSRSRVVIDAETVLGAGQADPDTVGRTYLARAEPHRSRPDGRYVDKLPANFLYAGFIARALPRATIVCLRRNPMDAVWSNYKHLFAAGSAYYFYSYDLMDTARYYARFDRLMAFWARSLPGRVLNLSYEALVDDQEGETRRLLAHCGLAWDDACLTFHENAAAVATPSAAQVRRPMNRDAIGRWKAHAAELGEVRAFFEGQGIGSDQ